MRFDHLLFPLFFMTLFTPNLILSTITKPQKLITRLVHPGLVNEPYSMKSSMTRYLYLQAKAKTSRFSDNIQESLFPTFYGLLLLANISIGQPPIPQEVVMDTGSDLLWVKCAPCEGCLQQDYQMFDPLTSSTYRRELCYSSHCESHDHRHGCDELGDCEYIKRYMGNVTSKGVLAREQLTFDTSDGGFIQTPDILFGCGHKTILPENMVFNWSGILGLSSAANSIAYQLGNKFSYCLGSLSDITYAYNHLALGEGANLQGYSTPMEIANNLYHISLEGINIGNKMVQIHSDMDIVIDSGTTVSYLTMDVFNSLKTEIETLIDNMSFEKVDVPKEPWKLCYEGMVRRDLIGFPTVTFHFSDGVDLDLDAESMFLQYSTIGRNLFCMAMEPTPEESDVSILGIVAQQNYNVGYDLEERKLYFQRIDCQLLMD